MKRNLNNNVMSKIAGITKDKVELKSEVIELSALPNLILTAAKEALKELNNSLKKLTDAEKAVNSANMSHTDAENRVNDSKRMFGKVLPQLKELGLKQDDIPDLKEAKKIVGEYNQKESIYRSMLSGLSKK